MKGPAGKYLDRKGKEFSDEAMRALEPLSNSDTDGEDKGPVGPAQNEGNTTLAGDGPPTTTGDGPVLEAPAEPALAPAEIAKALGVATVPGATADESETEGEAGVEGGGAEEATLNQ